MAVKSIAVAPMMDCTDKHDRYFLRLISPNVELYTEMITAQALHHGDVEYLLNFNKIEHPVTLQLGGSDPILLANGAKLGESYGYDAINLNVGCPSSRVSAGRFGACLMKEPALVADCVSAMRSVVNIPVTVKCRIGVDEEDSYEQLHAFISQVASAGCESFIIHARKAWLSGLSPKQNREIPPLRYDVVHKVKADFLSLNIILNGGIKSIADIEAQLPYVDGVMIGRAVYANPYLLAEIQKQFFDNTTIKSRHEIMFLFMDYVKSQLKNNVRLSAMTRHILGLFQGQRGAAAWRRYMSEHTYKENADVEVLKQSLALVT